MLSRQQNFHARCGALVGDTDAAKNDVQLVFGHRRGTIYSDNDGAGPTHYGGRGARPSTWKVVCPRGTAPLVNVRSKLRSGDWLRISDTSRSFKVNGNDNIQNFDDLQFSEIFVIRFCPCGGYSRSGSTDDGFTLHYVCENLTCGAGGGGGGLVPAAAGWEPGAAHTADDAAAAALGPRTCSYALPVPRCPADAPALVLRRHDANSDGVGGFLESVPHLFAPNASAVVETAWGVAGTAPNGTARLDFVFSYACRRAFVVNTQRDICGKKFEPTAPDGRFVGYVTSDADSVGQTPLARLSEDCIVTVKCKGGTTMFIESAQLAVTDDRWSVTLANASKPAATTNVVRRGFGSEEMSVTGLRDDGTGAVVKFANTAYRGADGGFFVAFHCCSDALGFAANCSACRAGFWGYPFCHDACDAALDCGGRAEAATADPAAAGRPGACVCERCAAPWAGRLCEACADPRGEPRLGCAIRNVSATRAPTPAPTPEPTPAPTPEPTPAPTPQPPGATFEPTPMPTPEPATPMPTPPPIVRVNATPAPPTPLPVAPAVTRTVPPPRPTPPPPPTPEPAPANATASATLTADPPTAAPEPTAPPQPPAVQGTTQAASVAAASAGLVNPAVAAQTARAGAVFSLASCTTDLDAPLGWSESPTQARVTGDRTRWFVGAALLNPAVFVAVGAAHLAWALSRGELASGESRSVVWTDPERRATALANARWPAASLVMVTMFLLQPTVSSGVTAVRHGGPLAKGLAAGALAVMAGAFAGLLKHLHGGWGSAFDGGVYEAHRSNFRVFLNGHGKWLDTEGHEGFTRMWGLCFTMYRDGFHWFMLTEVAVSTVVGVLDGLRSTDPAECRVLMYCLLGVNGAYLLAMVGARPFTAAFDTWPFVAIAAMQAAAPLVVVLSQHGVGGTALRGVGEYCALGTMVVASVKGIADLVYEAYKWKGREAKKALLAKAVAEDAARKERQSAADERAGANGATASASALLAAGGDGGAAVPNAADGGVGAPLLRVPRRAGASPSDEGSDGAGGPQRNPLAARGNHSLL